MESPESWALESAISLRIGIQNPSSTNKDWDPLPGIRNPGPLHGASLIMNRSLVLGVAITFPTSDRAILLSLPRRNVVQPVEFVGSNVCRCMSEA